MNMLRLFESKTTVKKNLENPNGSRFFLPFPSETKLPEKCDRFSNFFLKRTLFISIALVFYINCLPANPGVVGINVFLLRDLLNLNGPSVDSAKKQNPTDQNSTPTETGDTAITPSPGGVLSYPKTDFSFGLGEYFEIKPSKIENIESSKVNGKLPEGLYFQNSNAMLYGSVNVPLIKNSISIQAKTTNKEILVTKLTLTIVQLEDTTTLSK